MLSVALSRTDMADRIMGERPQRFVVLVDFGAEEVATKSRSLATYARIYDAALVTVDTSQHAFLKNNRHVNEAFEFSGYQYGLEQALALARKYTENGFVELAFANGTALTAHLRIMLRLCLSRAFGYDDPPLATPRLRGFIQPCGYPAAVVARLGFYIPTFVFSLVGSVRRLEALALYDTSAVGTEAFARKYRAAGPEYAAMVRAWLTPASLMRGWYQAVPYQAPDPATLYRKSLTIYLEHSLPGWLTTQGVDVAPFGVRCWERFVLRLSILLDRLFVNSLKLRYRLRRRLANRRLGPDRTS